MLLITMSARLRSFVFRYEEKNPCERNDSITLSEISERSPSDMKRGYS